MAHTLPAQRSPSGAGFPASTRTGRPEPWASRAATSPVPSVLPSSTTMTLSAPGYSWPSSAGRVAGSTSASFLAGTTATTSGHSSGSAVTGGSRWLVRQYPPCAATR
jgi:hypothetical protein